MINFSFLHLQLVAFILPFILVSNLNASPRPLALESAEPENSLLVMGGSFSPITEMHLALMADTLYEHSFPHGFFLVANPYKEGAENVDVVLKLTQVAVESFDFILRKRNIPFRDFRITGPGHVTWISKAGRLVHLEMSRFDVDNHISESVDSILYFRKLVGHPRNLWWLAGGDSGASMPKWGPRWKEMFENTNMIFIGRQSSPGELSIDHTLNNPLQQIYPKDFLGGYEYRREGNLHFYQARDPLRPSLYILNRRTLPISSTKVRQSLLTERQGEAQMMLTPSVYRAIVEGSHYQSTRAHLSRQNLETLLVDELQKIEEGKNNSSQYVLFIKNLISKIKIPKPSGQSVSGPPAEPSPSISRETELFPGASGTTPRTPRNLISLRRQLLLGDPRFLVSRMAIRNGYGVRPDREVTFNLVKSQMSHELPLSVRQAADRDIDWLDLNISINEMRNILGDGPLAEQLEISSRNEQGALANYLAVAIHNDARLRLRFELFSSRRYFSRLALGTVRPEFQSELSPEEKSFETWAKSFINSIENVLTRSQIEKLIDAIADVYIISRTASLRPELLETNEFWTEFLSLAVTGYPGEFLDLNRDLIKKKVVFRLTLLGHLLPLIRFKGGPESKSSLDINVRIVHNGHSIGYFDRSVFVPASNFDKLESQLFSDRRQEGIHNLGVLSGAKKYLDTFFNSSVFLEGNDPFGPITMDFLPDPQPSFLSTLTGRPSPDQNLIRDMHFFAREMGRDLKLIDKSFWNMTPESSAEFNRPRDENMKMIRDLCAQFEALEIFWLRKKKAYPFESIDSDVPGYFEALEKYQWLQAGLAKSIDERRAINHVAMGITEELSDAMGLTPSASASREISLEMLFNEIISDAFRKYIVSFPGGPLGSDLRVALQSLSALTFDELRNLRLEDLLFHVLKRQHPVSDPEVNRRKAKEIWEWLNQKYGFTSEVILRPMNVSEEGSYRSEGPIHFEMKRADLHPLFDLDAPSSLTDLDVYIKRKWGGLNHIARPDQVIFSELGTHDTIRSLRLQGYREFFQVNSSYSMRGSKTMLAFKPIRAEPLIIFHSFIGVDLLQHKKMQLALDFRDDFEKVRILTSDGPKSWDQAVEVLAKGVQKLPDHRIDDLMLGYGEVIANVLEQDRSVRHIETSRLGDFAEVAYFAVLGKIGIPRNVAVVTRMDYRYFGKSVLPLILPFLQRGVDRVIFAGSAGVTDPQIGKHKIVAPRNFMLLNDSGRVDTIAEITNDFYDLAPYGVVYSGPHISVLSPLIESRQLIRRLRDENQILSIDVEGSQIAKLIQEFNAQTKRNIRYASAYIVTDVPQLDDSARANFGLHEPDFEGKKKAKELYALLVKLVLGLPTRMGYSAHSSLIAQFYLRQFQSFSASSYWDGMKDLFQEVRFRRDRVIELSRSGERVSRGLIKIYGDLLAHYESHAFASGNSLSRKDFVRSGPNNITGGHGDVHANRDANANPNAEVHGDLRGLPLEHQRAIALQSMTRSATLNTGDVVYLRGKRADAETLGQSVQGAHRAVDWIFANRHRPMTGADVKELHSCLTEGVLSAEHQGVFSNFDYTAVTGETRTSAQVLNEFFTWLESVEPSYQMAIEAFTRYEAIHPHKDGSGRMSELIAQHLLLRGGLSPLLFPNRFDIDYILTLNRNGGFVDNRREFVSELVRNTAVFAEGIRRASAHSAVTHAKFNSDSGHLELEMADGRDLQIKVFYVSDRPIALEREVRSFVKVSDLPAELPAVLVQRKEYGAYYVFEPRRGCRRTLTQSP
jgi:nicotinic acid mononucleotide adenylyltransferase